MKAKILGISASLRNARRGLGNVELVDEINSKKTEEQLKAFLSQEALQHLENFKSAGRTDKAPFDQIYTNLKKLKGNKGLSNSEVALASALWSAKEIGAEIDHLSLAEYFKEEKDLTDKPELEAKLLESDGILISTPVYFGDRGSLSQTFITYLRQRPNLLKKLNHKIYAGIAVGAKRNGGQETTLIYQLIDMINLGFLGVGNDSETTSQYGGTGLAGDIGTMSKDEYGLATAMGTGRRIARVATMMKKAENSNFNDKLNIVVWLLQDRKSIALDTVKLLFSRFGNRVNLKIIDFVNSNIIRCLACDICPTHIDVDEEYRCIIKSKKDDLSKIHEELLVADAIIPVVYSPVERDGLQSNYQRLMERTRYFRRGDYVFSDLLTAPLVIEDIGSSENMHIRMMTSMVRHHTILSKPQILYRYKGKEVNIQEIQLLLEDFLETSKKVISAKLFAYASSVNHLKYKPVGYVLSSAKDAEDEKLKKRSEMIEGRMRKAKIDLDKRVEQ